MKKISVYQCVSDEYIDMTPIGKALYTGESFYGDDGLTDGKEYYIIENDGGMFRVVDNSGEDYLYSINNPAPGDGSSRGGKWKLVEDYTGELKQYIN